MTETCHLMQQQHNMLAGTLVPFEGWGIWREHLTVSRYNDAVTKQYHVHESMK